MDSIEKKVELEIENSNWNGRSIQWGRIFKMADSVAGWFARSVTCLLNGFLTRLRTYLLVQREWRPIYRSFDIISVRHPVCIDVELSATDWQANKTDAILSQSFNRPLATLSANMTNGGHSIDPAGSCGCLATRFAVCLSVSPSLCLCACVSPCYFL